MIAEMPKKISDDIIYFIESIVLEYDLEKDFIEKDILLKKKLSGIDDLAERISNKLLFSKTINDYIKNNKPLEEILASFKIKKLIEELVNNKISFDDLNALLSQNIKASPEIIQSIVEKIKNSSLIKELMSSEIGESEELIDGDEYSKKNTNTKSIGNILLKKD